jgi:hypothetical protein
LVTRANAITRPSARPGDQRAEQRERLVAPGSGISTQDSPPATPVSASNMTVRTTTSSSDIIWPVTAGGAGG